VSSLGGDIALHAPLRDFISVHHSIPGQLDIAPVSTSQNLYLQPTFSCYSNFIFRCPNKLLALKDALPDFNEAATTSPPHAPAESQQVFFNQLIILTLTTALDRHAVKHVKNFLYLSIVFAHAPRLQPLTYAHISATHNLRLPHAQDLSGNSHDGSRYMHHKPRSHATPHRSLLPYLRAHLPPSTLPSDWRCARCAPS
jgi:hypothetical protein